MTTPSDPPDESAKRAQDCRAKAAYCKWVASISPDENLREFYAELAVEWEKEAARVPAQRSLLRPSSERGLSSTWCSTRCSPTWPVSGSQSVPRFRQMSSFWQFGANGGQIGGYRYVYSDSHIGLVEQVLAPRDRGG